MSIQRVCVREVDLAGPDETVREAARRMHDHKVGCLVVCNSSQEPIGILTDRDLATRIVAEGKDPNVVNVGEVMTRNPRCIDEKASLEKAICALRAGACRRLPVVDGEKRLVGLVTLDDVLSLLSSDFREIAALLWAEKPESLASI